MHYGHRQSWPTLDQRAHCNTSLLPEQDDSGAREWRLKLRIHLPSLARVPWIHRKTGSNEVFGNLPAHSVDANQENNHSFEVTAQNSWREKDQTTSDGRGHQWVRWRLLSSKTLDIPKINQLEGKIKGLNIHTPIQILIFTQSLQFTLFQIFQKRKYL